MQVGQLHQTTSLTKNTFSIKGEVLAFLPKLRYNLKKIMQGTNP